MSEPSQFSLYFLDKHPATNQDSLYNQRMIDPTHILYIHGSDSSSQTYKATLLHDIFPGLRIPNFVGGLPERMEQLKKFWEPNPTGPWLAPVWVD